MSTDTDPFKDIRPYSDAEIRPVLDNLMSDREFIGSIANFYFPTLSKILPPIPYYLARIRLRKQLSGVKDVATMQDVIALYMDKMIEDTTTSLSNSGLENLTAGRSYLFVCNHRDIVMDPAFVNYMLYHAGFETLQIAIGDNLLKKPFVSDLMRLNKSFIVKRSSKGRELLKSLTQLSAYIHHCVGDDQNVWIAQKEGRAKDGLDVTDPALMKMLAMYDRKAPIGEALSKLHIVPVSISYEYDACDELKASELYQKASAEGFVKSDRSDIDSIVTGMVGFKGRVHVAFGTELAGLEELGPEEIAGKIDQQIVQNYQLRDSHYLALEELISREAEGVAELTKAYDAIEIGAEARQFFVERLAAVAPELQEIYLYSYANPLIRILRQNKA